MSEISTKPYLIRAIFEWCNDAGFTPYLNVKVDQNVRVPIEYVKNGEIVLSVAQQATRDLTMGNDRIQFSARFNGVSREISIPVYAVQAIFARENGRGYFFEPEDPPAPAANGLPASPSTPVLQSVHAGVPILQSVRTAATTATVGDAAADHADAAATVTPSPVMVPDGEDGDESGTNPDKPRGPPRGNLRIIK